MIKTQIKTNPSTPPLYSKEPTGEASPVAWGGGGGEAIAGFPAPMEAAEIPLL